MCEQKEADDVHFKLPPDLLLCDVFERAENPEAGVINEYIKFAVLTLKVFNDTHPRRAVRHIKIEQREMAGKALEKLLKRATAFICAAHRGDNPIAAFEQGPDEIETDPA